MKKTELKSLLKIITEEVVAMQLEQTSELPPDIQNVIEDLKKRLIYHDWSWRESDDPREYGNGQRKEEYIDKLMYDISKAGYKDAALKAWDEATRERFKAHPKMLPMAYGKANSLPDNKISESKGLSGMKKAAESSEHTENVADSKDLTGPAPKEKQEGKKLPVVKKPANPQKIGNIKEEILRMIREEIDEMARVKGAIGSKFKVKDPSSPTGWVVKGHKTVPDGTPTEAPSGPYIKKGKYADTTGSPTTPSSSSKKPVSARETELAVADILKYNPNATDEEIAAELASRSENGEPLNLAPSIIAHAIDMTKDAEKSPDSGADEPAAPDFAAKEKAEKQKKMDRLRSYLMRKRGIKPTE